MQENVRKYLTKLKENRKLRRRNQLVMIAVGLLVVSGVFGMLIMPGLGEETKPVCGITEHTHTEECKGNICEKEVHVHTEDCMEPTCGSNEHMHSEECKNYTCGSEDDAHVHTAECDFVYGCNLEEHTHTDGCNIVVCQLEEHEHTEECTGYVCGVEEHGHTEECYSQTDTGVNAQILSYTSDSDVNEGLVVSVSSSETEALSGQTLKVNVSSQYSGPNDGEKATVALNISKLPEGVRLIGFTNNVYEMQIEETDRNVTVHLEEKDDGSSYVWFNQALGDTVHFELTFESTNGIMDEKSEVIVSLDKDNTKIPDGINGNVTIKDNKDSVTLTWTAENEWDPVDKTVSAEKLAVNAENKLSGVITYTIKANSLNKDSFGDIWTKYVTVTDTLTLPEKISLPDGVEVKEGQIVASDGNAILYFTKLQGGSVTSLSIGSDKKTVTYVLEIPNTNKDENENEYFISCIGRKPYFRGPVCY